MKAHAVRSATSAALLLLLLLCIPAASCITPDMFGPRDTGGVYMVLAVKADTPALEETIQNVSRVIENRCSALRVYCATERQGGAGSNLIRLRVSGAQDFKRVKAVLLAAGKLELRQVVSAPFPAPLTTYPTHEAAGQMLGGYDEVVPFEEGTGVTFIKVRGAPVVTGLDVRSVTVNEAASAPNNYVIDFTLKPDGAERFAIWTGSNINNYLAVVLNGKARAAPYIKSVITDSGQITGSFTKQEAEDVALTLRSGSLPVRLEVLEEGTYKP